jgi:WD40 repeat protein
MRKVCFLSLCLSVVSLGLSAQKVGLDTLAQLPAELKEISAMVSGSKGAIWALNDSGNDPIVYKIDRNGKILSRTYIANAQNVDWEELAIDPNGFLYIGDFGNNRNDRQDLKIYIVNEKKLVENDTAFAEVINFTYPDQKEFPPKPAHRNFDMEAMVFYQGKLVLFSKNRTDPFNGYCYLYKLPSWPGTYVAEKIDSIKLGDGPRELFQITAADLSPDGNSLVLLSYDKFFVIFDFPYNDLVGGRVVAMAFKELSQKESVAWVTDSTLLVADEKSVLGGGYLYDLDLSSALKENSNARKIEVKVPMKEFKDSLFVEFESEVRGKVFYEFFDGDGRRVSSGDVGYFDRGKHSFNIVPPDFPNGAYLLNVQLGKRPHAFFVYRFNAVDWEKVKAEFEKRKKELQK